MTNSNKKIMKRAFMAILLAGAVALGAGLIAKSSTAAPLVGDSNQSVETTMGQTGDYSLDVISGSRRCYQCSGNSTGACKRNSNSYARCWGTKKECKARGCKGMSSSSSSCKGYGANVPRC